VKIEIVVGSERNNGSKEYSQSKNPVEMETKRDPDESREKDLWGKSCK
jgi:hypothetical protein